MTTIRTITKNIFAEIKAFPRQFGGLLASMWHYIFTPITKPSIFWGYWAYYFATWYAEKRTRKWPPKYDQNGSINGVFVYSEDTLIVLNKMEIKNMKKLSPAASPLRKINPRKFLNRASYYKTKQK